MMGTFSDARSFGSRLKGTCRSWQWDGSLPCRDIAHTCPVAVRVSRGTWLNLYIAAVAIVANTCYTITAAWLLVFGAFDQSTA
jgi:hypothetical protein